MKDIGLRFFADFGGANRFDQVPDYLVDAMFAPIRNGIATSAGRGAPVIRNSFVFAMIARLRLL